MAENGGFSCCTSGEWPESRSASGLSQGEGRACGYPRLAFQARSCGFTAEELDFILSYDIKHRVGQDNGGEDRG